jgi:hypothetical protein
MIEIIHNEKKLLGRNWKLSFLHSQSNYSKLDEQEKHNCFEVNAFVM